MNGEGKGAGLLRWCLGMIAVAFFVGVWFWLAQAPFHEDEAIYAAWALGMARGDWALWQIPTDKPPLTFYPLALMMAWGARAEWMVRLPTFFWGLLALWGVGRLAIRLGRDKWMVWGFVLASPLWWAMWASAFTDMGATALGIWGVGVQREEQGERRKGGEQEYEAWLAGVLMGVAVLAKPTMIFLLPLLMGGRGEGKRGKGKGERRKEKGETADTSSRIRMGNGWAFSLATLFQSWRGWVEGFAAVLLLAWAWDVSRDAPSWWRLGAEAYGTLGRSWSAGVAWGWLAVGVAGLSLLYGILKLLIKEKERKRFSWARVQQTSLFAFRFPLSLNAILFWMICLWIPLHWLLGFQPWERYLLPWLLLLAVGVAPEERKEKGERGERQPSPHPSPRKGRDEKAFLRSFLLSPFSFLLIVAPFLIAPLQFAPQDGRWNGIREIGAAIEALPEGSEVWYRAIGRPLAWYAADARAELQWAGVEWEAFPGCGAGIYIAARLDEPRPDGVEAIIRNGDFGVWQCRGP